MRDCNKITIIGFLGRDPEVRETKGGKKQVRMSVSTSEYWNDKATGERKNLTEWHICVAWDKAADAIEAQQAHKGTRVMISGKLHYNSYKKQDGTDAKETQILVDDFGVMEKNAATGGEYSTGPRKPISNVQMIDDEDMPF